MSAEWVTAIATVGTFIVIAASAFAALRQIGHMRSGNAIPLLNAYNNEFDTQEFQLAFNYVRSTLPERLKEDGVLEELAKAPPLVDEFAVIRIAPVAFLLREKHQPQIWENFEYLAVLGATFIEQHPAGVYPKSTKRMPVDNRLVERYL